MNHYIIKKEPIQVYNSYTKKKDIFSPIQDKYVGMYVCGPTVYKKAHLGNYRTFIFFDVVFRYFKILGYKVRYIRNITDIGHIENNIDKILQSAMIEQIEPMEIAQKYTVHFHNMHKCFNILHPSIEPIATGHIIEQLNYIKKIIKTGFAYENNGSIYFDIKKYSKYYNYGIFKNININHNNYLHNKNLDKKNVIDFALWKKADKYHIMKWRSPWGYGFPGWHIECTSMSHKYLGKNFDIHGGGLDLKFPHHECELSQSTSIHGSPSANYWMHVNLLTFKNHKISKTANNFFSLEDIISGNTDYFIKSFHPIILKFFLLQSHYRNIVDISNESLLQSEKNYHFILRAINILNNNSIDLVNSIEHNQAIITWCQNCYSAINNDFNTPLLISYMLQGSKYINLIKQKYMQVNMFNMKIFKHTFNKFFFDVLGLDDIHNKIIFNEYENNFNLLINLIIKIRYQYRLSHNWELSDLIRQELSSIGILLQDNGDETIFSYDMSFNKK